MEIAYKAWCRPYVYLMSHARTSIDNTTFSRSHVFPGVCFGWQAGRRRYEESHETLGSVLRSSPRWLVVGSLAFVRLVPVQR
jgi:hypothetical protein